MDDLVKQAMAKWPNVPDCFGWLGLDARGDWYMRDDRVQSLGTFPAHKGSKLEHEKLKAFIGRNYSADVHGRWYFQNGPQRVFVELEIAPWVWRVHADGAVFAHTEQVARPQRCWIDEQGRVYLETHLGFGLVHSLDVGIAAEHVESGLWVLQSIAMRDMPQRFGYVLSPNAAQACPP
jgi:hypothetical protein